MEKCITDLVPVSHDCSSVADCGGIVTMEPIQLKREKITTDEIDLKLLFDIVWRGRWIVLCFAFFFSMGSIFYALSLPDQYTAKVILAPSQSESGGMNGIAAQYGGLASLAGINLGGSSSNRLEQAVEVLNNWPFLDDFVRRHELAPYIMAVEKWDRDLDDLQWDRKLYNEITKTWMIQDDGKDMSPSSYQIYKRFSKMIKASLDAKSGFMFLEVESVSPQLSYEWVNLLVHDINQHFQQIDINESRKNIEYLKEKISETSVSEMQAVFYSLIESQTKSLMLAEVGEQYLVKVIVPAMLPEVRSRPNRVLICSLGIFLGICCGLFISFFIGIRNIGFLAHEEG